MVSPFAVPLLRRGDLQTRAAALRQVAHPTPGTYLTDRAEEFRETAREVVQRSAHGRARAHRILAFADGRAQLPGGAPSGSPRRVRRMLRPEPGARSF